MLKKVWIGLIVYALILPVYAQTHKSKWVDSVFSTLDLNAKIGQLLMIPLESHSDKGTLVKTLAQIKKYKIGGVVFTKGSPTSQAKITNSIQQQSSIPLLVGMNAERGLGEVLDSTVQFPDPIMLGAIRDDSLLFFLGAEIGRQLKELGVNISFAPSSHVSNSVESGSILYNSFGENTERVAAKVLAYQNGLKSKGILSVVRHSELEGTEINTGKLLPLQKLLENGSAGIIINQLQDALIEKNPLQNSSRTNSQSTNHSTDYLKNQMNFNGLLFSHTTQLLNKKINAGKSELLAFQAGYDVLLFPLNLDATVRKFRKAARKNKMLQQQLDESVKKILTTKFDAGLHQKKVVNTENLLTRINSTASTILQSALMEKSVTVVRDDRQLLPIKQLDDLLFASVSIGNKKENTLTSYLSKYASFTHYQLEQDTDTINLLKNLHPAAFVVIALYPNANKVKNQYQSLIKKIGEQTKVIAVEFGAPSKNNLFDKHAAIIQAYTDHELVQKVVPQIIFGAKKANGTLPVFIQENMPEGQGIETALLGRMAYSTPEGEGFDTKIVDHLSSIAYEAIDQKAAPGCQVLVARHGKIIFEKSFGTQTYENKIPVNDETIYDLASLSKVLGTLQAVQFLYEKGVIDLYKKASLYLPELANTNKKDIILKDILTHQSGLFPFLLMWPQTVKGDTLLQHYYSPIKNENYPLQVATDLFASKSIQDSVWQWVLRSEMLPKPPRTPYSTRYSDLGFMILHRMVERLVNQPMEDFLDQNLYAPIGAGTVGYLPLTKFLSTQIAPTELDTIFRKSMVVGTVHDERAALLGGVAGHAGLFGNSTDLIKIGQMLLQKGSYGGVSFYKPETVELFAQKQFENSTRGLGWAKSGDPNSPSSRFGSPKAFGHTGFTGTCLWVDPEFDLVYVFLSNSRFPYRSAKLNSTNIRSRIQDAIYQSIFDFCQYGETHPDQKLIQFLNRSSN